MTNNIYKKFQIATFIAFFIMLSSMSIHAQRIAIVDVDKVLNNVNDYKNAQQELDQVANKWRQEIAQEYDKIKSLYNSYQADQVLLSDQSRKDREEEIVNAEKRVRDLQKERFGPEGLLFERRRELVQPIQERVYQTIEKYAKDRGYDFIFDKGGSAGLIFSKADKDKTDDIISRLK